MLLGCRAEGVNLLIPVAVLHFAAFTMGYWLSKGLKFNEKTARTVSIETGTLAQKSPWQCYGKCVAAHGAHAYGLHATVSIGAKACLPLYIQLLQALQATRMTCHGRDRLCS